MVEMVVRRVVAACAIMALATSSVAACALLVGDPQGFLLFEPDAAPDVNAGTDAIGSPVDAEADGPSETGPAGDEGMPEAGDAAPPSDGGPSDVWSDADAAVHCQIDPGDLITNGDFSQGDTDWAIVANTSGTIEGDAGVLCVAAVGGQETILAWTPGTNLTPNTYDFWYCAWTSEQSITVYATIGQSMPPNDPDYKVPAQTVTTSVHPITTQPFSISSSDTSAGLSFQFTPSVSQDVCFAAVSLVPAN